MRNRVTSGVTSYAQTWAHIGTAVLHGKIACNHFSVQEFYEVQCGYL